MAKTLEESLIEDAVFLSRPKEHGQRLPPLKAAYGAIFANNRARQVEDIDGLAKRLEPLVAKAIAEDIRQQNAILAGESRRRSN